jgi:branched-chain amino acid transport system substrate-binding protein
MSRATSRHWRVLACVVLIATVFAACGKSKSSSSSGSCKNLTLAFLGALTGDHANLGINERNGMKLAIKEYNDKHSSCQVKEVDKDSQGDPAQAPALAQNLAQDKNVLAVIGPPFSGESKTGDPILNEAGIPLITASATNPGLSTHGWTVFHRAVGNDNSQGPAAAKYILENLKAKKVAVIDDASEYGKGIADIVRAKLRDGGATVTVSDVIDPKASDFSSTVNKVKPTGSEAVFLGGYYQAGGVLAKQLKDAGVKATFVGPDGVNDPGFIKAAGTASEGAILLAPGAPPDKVPGSEAFRTAYKALNNLDSGLYSAEAYDATNALLEAVSKGHRTRSSINDYLKTIDYKGLSVELKFDDKGELSSLVTIWASKVEAGQIVAQAPIAI